MSPSTMHDSAPKTNGDHKPSRLTGPDRLKRPPRQLRKSREYRAYRVDAKNGRAHRPVRKSRFPAALAAMGFVAVAGLMVIAIWSLLSGIAEGLGVLFGDRPWLGNAVTGFLLLAGRGLGMYYTVAVRRRLLANAPDKACRGINRALAAVEQRVP